MDNETDVWNWTIQNVTSTVYITKDTLNVIIFIVAIIMIPAFCLLGSIGNILSIRVLANKRMRNQTNTVLLALCISDTLFLIHCLLYTFINAYSQSDPIRGEAFRSHVYPYIGAYGSVITARFTSCLTTLLSIQRFVAVFYPMQAKTICTRSNTIVAIVTIYIVTSLVFIPFIFKYESVEIIVNENITRHVMNKTTFYENNVKFYSVYGTVLNVIFRFSPLIIIFILNIVMIKVVHRTWKERRSMSIQESDSPQTLRLCSRNNRHCSSHDQQKITAMLVTVSMVFLVCILPGAVNSIATHVASSYSPVGKKRNLYMLISTITFLLETINSSVNFIIYMAMSKRFRLLYKEMFCCGHGEYYRKISFTSVKEQFRWSANKKNARKEDGSSNGRRTQSDIGPLLNGSLIHRERPWAIATKSECWDIRNARTSLDIRQSIASDVPEVFEEEGVKPQSGGSGRCPGLHFASALARRLIPKHKNKHANDFVMVNGNSNSIFENSLHRANSQFWGEEINSCVTRWMSHKSIV